MSKMSIEMPKRSQAVFQVAALAPAGFSKGQSIALMT